jgi:hypothetical protein
MVIPIKGQYEQICNSVALKEMGIFVGNDINDIKKFINEGIIIDYKWIDPINNIIMAVKS